jgi:NAD(P)-dependent dehydrogenase (short-subunit alcohol dehydrogenase family)
MARERYDVRDRVVFVTGAARGIGAEAARRLADRGAYVSLVGLEPELLEHRALGDIEYSFKLQCQSTADNTVGSTCAVATTLDSLVPNTVPEGRHSIWELGQVRIDDGGNDVNVETVDDNELFAVQGIYLP